MKETKSSNRYTVVDLEATGTGIDAKIIQIGIVIVENGQIVETFSTDINPYEPLDEHIVDLTGITDKQLSQAPSLGQVAGQIYELLADAIFVAHNVTFDANLLAEALFFEGYELRTPRVDTVELSQVFFPTIDKYSLGNLSDKLDLGLDQAHTALADATATANLLLKIQEKILSLPKSMVEQLVQLSDCLLYESRLVIEELLPQLSEQVSLDLVCCHGLFLQESIEVPVSRKFSDDFVTNLGLLGLYERKKQTAFAGLVEERLSDEQQVHFIQAQAGLGKTYGYLLPLLAKTDQKLLVSVPTKLLQEQIMSKEGKRLSEVFHISISSLKAPQHFIKLDNYWQTLQRQDDNRLVNQFKMQVLVWLSETQTGDLDELKQKQRYQAYFDEIAHDGKLSEDSLFWDQDFWRKVQRRAVDSRLLITNHAYFLSHLKDQDPLMNQRLVVIDEAQKLLLAAENLATGQVNMTQLLQTLQSKKDRTSNLLDQRLYESCQFELQHLMTDFRKQADREITRTDLDQLRQNLLELQDYDLQELTDLLTYYERFWLEDHLLADKRLTYLRGTKEDLLDVSSYLPQGKIFCISATLDISSKVNLADLLGFQEVTFDRLPHQLTTNQQIIIPRGLPDIQSLTKEEHAGFIAERLGEIAELGRPILVLFTSISLLLEVADLLEEASLPYLAQHKHGTDASLKRRFERGECQILLGTGIFWEGADFADQDQMIQVIPRLPFENPKDSFVQKVNRKLIQEGKNPFYDYHLPMMMIKLKQAIGRTNRYDRQESAVLLLDNRLQTKQYGQQVIDFLEQDYPVEGVQETAIMDALSYFFSE
ncbi:bifunctional DnaQ family exonuclease/ATP-dependent helicase [Streptococcus suis]